MWHLSDAQGNFDATLQLPHKAIRSLTNTSKNIQEMAFSNEDSELQMTEPGFEQYSDDN